MITRRIHLCRPPTDVRLDEVVDKDRTCARNDGQPQDSPRAIMSNEPQANAAASVEPVPDLTETVASIFEEIAELEDRRQGSIDELRELAMELACFIASHILNDAVECGQLPTERMIDQALDHLGATANENVTIRLHPEDYQALEKPWNDQTDDNGPAQKPDLIPDPSLKRGTCEATTDGRGVLVDVHDQLKQIRHELTKTLNHAKAERRDPEKNNQHVQRYPDRRNTA